MMYSKKYYCPGVRTALMLYTYVIFASCASVGTTETSSSSSSPSPSSTQANSNSPENSTVFPILIPNYKRHNNVVFLELQKEDAIDWEHDFRKCGRSVEGCPDPTTTTSSSVEKSTSGDNDNLGHNATIGNQTDGIRHHHHTSLIKPGGPTSCKCDENCTRYGDCCVTVLQRLQKIPRDSYYRCVQLPDSKPHNHSVRMISKCPPSYQKDMNRKLCENPVCPSENENVNHKSLCPLLDVPVLNNKTGELYRSIFCARCHSVSNQNIHSMNRALRCSNFTSRSEWEEFQKRSVYQPGELRWSDPTNASVNCKLYIQDLQPKVIKRLIPDVRFCSKLGREECSLDLDTEEDRITYNLCFSYTQVVRMSSGETFKNPHCAKCYHPDIDFKKGVKCVREDRQRAEFPISPRLTPTADAPVGINILFHFSLDMDDGFVGFTSKCDGDEILDFIRQRCVPAVCPKGYLLNDGQCEKILTANDNSSLSSSSGTETMNNRTLPFLISPRGGGTNSSSTESEASNSSEPCFLIFLHPGEYRQLANGSLSVNKSSGSKDVLLFQPGEYEKYNDSSMSICAENVEATFVSTFAPALSYISNILLALSVLCSMIHVALYLILPKMRNLPGNNLLCLTACLLISQFIFLTLIKASNRTVCVIAATTMHYLFLASFCWMNIMSFDIWRTFSSEFLVRRYSGDSLRTFIKYSLFAWIAPLLIVILAIVTDFSLPESLLVDPSFGPFVRKLRPLYGHNNLCWIGQRLSLFVFFAFPVGLIILCNLALFTLTAFTIWLQNREGSRFINASGGGAAGNNAKNGTPPNNGARKGNNKTPLHGCNSGSTKKSDRVRFKLYAKLALIMGLTWILGFLSGFAEWEWLWYPFVIFNGLQGTFIFVAFDCKSKIWNMVKDKCGLKRKKSRRGTGGDGSSDLKRRGTTTLSSTLRSSSKRTSSTTDGAGGISLVTERSNRRESSNGASV